MALPFHVEQPIAAPPEAVWRFLLEIPNSGRWMQGTLAMEALTPGPIAIGSCFRQTRRIHGHVATADFVVAALDPASRTLSLEVDGRKGPLGRGVFRFRYAMRPAGADGSSTLVVLDGEIDALGRAVELLASFFVGNFVKVVARDLDGLRTCLEEGAAAPGADGDPVDGDPVDGDPVDGDPVDGDAARATQGVTTSSTSRVPST